MKKVIILIVILICYFNNIHAQRGCIDYTYNKSFVLTTDGTRANDIVYASAIQSDRKIIVGGAFTTYHGIARNHIVRLDEREVLDPGFNSGTGANGVVLAIRIQNDGKILIGGGFTSYNGNTRNFIARLNTDGSIDNTFNPGTGANGFVRSISIQSNGKIIVGGSFTLFNGVPGNRIVRLNEDGSIDASFNQGTGADNSIECSTLQFDGKILIGGFFNSYGGTLRRGIARLNTDGSLDAGFNPGSGTGGSSLNTISIQCDGKIIIGGTFSSFNGQSKSGIARLNENGSLDNGFNTGIWEYNYIFTTAIQSDGKIIIGGWFNEANGSAPENFVARLNPNGSYDATFCSGVGASNAVRTVSILNGVYLVIGGDFTTYNGALRNHLARLDYNGKFITDDNMGIGTDNTIYCTGMLTNDKTIIGGDFTNYNHVAANRIARINTDGLLDNTFLTGAGANGSVGCISVQNDEKIIIGGNFSSFNGVSRNRIARLKANGSLDTLFKPGTGADDFIYTTAIQSDGKIIIGGNFVSYNGTTINRIARLNPDGSMDTTFKPGTGANGVIRTLAVQVDGKIIIGGYFTSYNDILTNRIARINMNGSMDASFNVGSGTNNNIYSSALQSDGKIIIAGGFSSYNGRTVRGIARLYADGNQDTLFNIGSGVNGLVRTISIQSDGKIIIGGDVSAVDGTPVTKIACLNSDGSLDPGFYYTSGPNSTVYSLAQQSDDKIIVGGSYATFQGVAKKGLARIYNNVIRVSSLNPISFCQGGNVSVLFRASGLYNCGNVFTAELSDASGSFAAPINIGTLLSAASGTFNTVIPSGLSAGNGYRIRVVSSDPVNIGIDNGLNIAVNALSSSEHTEVHCDSYTAPDGAIYTSSGIKTAIIPNLSGCDSTITINLTINRSTTNSITLTTCDSYTAPDGATYSSSGIKTAVIPNSVGCDSTITINLTINSSNTSNITITACNSYIAPDGNVYTTSGIKTAVIPNAAGCDSTIMINLIINSSNTGNISITACNSYIAPDGNVYTASGIKTAVIQNSVGCDSTITINLTINNSNTSNISITTCNSYTAPDGNVYTTSGIKTAVIPNSVGCDSTITINLTINSSNTSNISAIACNSYTAPDGNVYTTSGIKTAVIPNSVGCDSIITINLTINSSTANAVSVSVCNSYTAPDGIVYTSSGIKTSIIPNSAGCDSIITINLTVNIVDTSVTNNDPTLFANAMDATYQWIFCGSGMNVPNATNQSFTPIIIGYYACVITQFGCTATSECYAVLTVGIPQPRYDRDIVLYPNPVSTELVIELTGNDGKVNYEIFNVTGQIVLNGSFVKKTTVQTSHFAPGVYMIKFENEKTINFKKIIKV